MYVMYVCTFIVYWMRLFVVTSKIYNVYLTLVVRSCIKFCLPQCFSLSVTCTNVQVNVKILQNSTGWHKMQWRQDRDALYNIVQWIYDT